ncbi:hypothetical protein HQ533_04830 [Candidatus Woesearchaeota archaeon]|nr:hypothetical protein [Candidatus Woesearchaeota archaeon]
MINLISIISFVLIIVLLYFYRKTNSLEKRMLKHIQLNHPEEYKELSIALPNHDDFKFILGKRIMRKSKDLPNDSFLDENYAVFRKNVILLFSFFFVLVALYIYQFILYYI